MKKRLVIAFALLLLLSTYNPQKLISIKIFDIKENDIDFSSVKSHTYLKEGSNINKIDILFKKIEKNND